MPLPLGEVGEYTVLVYVIMYTSTEDQYSEKPGLFKVSFMLDLSRAVIVMTPGTSAVEEKSIEMLVEEVEKRTRIRWSRVSSLPEDGPAIIVGQLDVVKNLVNCHSAIDGLDKGKAEGYHIWVDGSSVFVAGNDPRGVIYGVGRLLRCLNMRVGEISLPPDLRISTYPAYSLRGHQIGYRDKTNSYCAWDLEMWEQYVRDLVVFGANSIELIPPRSDDKPDSVHFPRPPLEMMEGVSRIADDYGVDVWIWFPAMDEDYTDAATVESSLEEWGQVFRRLPRIDAVFVPGGDPGHATPRVLMDLMERQAESLREHHPRAQMWISPQGFNDERMVEFLGILGDGPDWLDGVVFGPWVHMDMVQFRAMIPDRYPVRNYPDITHSLSCEYPVPEWDVAFALTEGREVINPRPRGQASIFRVTQPPTIGFLTYSEGCHDDVNKCVWSYLGWDPEADVGGILEDYSRYFIGAGYTKDFSRGLLALEENWVGPASENDGIDDTLELFREMERNARPSLLRNWRFQAALYRAYYDAYVKRRSAFETGLEEEAMGALARCRQVGSIGAMEEAEGILDRAGDGVAMDLRTRIFQLAEALFQSIRLQLSVPLYRAQAEVRGANLDGIDFPLNNGPWLRAQFEDIRSIGIEEERLKEIEGIINWTEPGPGGYYENLGSSHEHPHVVTGPGFEEDPGFWRSAFRQYPYQKSPDPLRLAWRGGTGTLKDTPFVMRYIGLDPEAEYAIRIIYSALSPQVRVRLTAGNGVEIHPYVPRENAHRVQEFEVPGGVTHDGELVLTWTREPGFGGTGQGGQVSEIWLIRK